MCPGECHDQAAAWEVLTRRHRQLVSSLIPQDKLDSAELGLVLILICLLAQVKLVSAEMSLVLV